jgi:hypothetical protein
MICPSPPLRALSRPTPPLARLKGRALAGRDFIFQMRFAHGLATKKEGGEIAHSFPTTLRLQILALETFCGIRRVFPVSNTGERPHGRFAGRGDRAGLDDLRRDMPRQIHLIVQNPYYVDHVAL